MDTQRPLDGQKIGKNKEQNLYQSRYCYSLLRTPYRNTHSWVTCTHIHHRPAASGSKATSPPPGCQRQTAPRTVPRSRRAGRPEIRRFWARRQTIPDRASGGKARVHFNMPTLAIPGRGIRGESGDRPESARRLAGPICRKKFRLRRAGPALQREAFVWLVAWYR